MSTKHLRYREYTLPWNSSKVNTKMSVFMYFSAIIETKFGVSSYANAYRLSFFSLPWEFERISPFPGCFIVQERLCTLRPSVPCDYQTQPVRSRSFCYQTRRSLFSFLWVAFRCHVGSFTFAVLGFPRRDLCLIRLEDPVSGRVFDRRRNRLVAYKSRFTAISGCRHLLIVFDLSSPRLRMKYRGFGSCVGEYLDIEGWIITVFVIIAD